MKEFLDECHLCGHVMASAAPACPNCFGRSDPAAREAGRRQRRKESLLQEYQLSVADSQFAADGGLQSAKLTIASGLLCLVCLPMAFSAVGAPWLSVFSVAGFFAFVVRDRLLDAVQNWLANQERETSEPGISGTPTTRTRTPSEPGIEYHDHAG